MAFEGGLRRSGGDLNSTMGGGTVGGENEEGGGCGKGNASSRGVCADQ
jgi:hypothetical protein